MTEAGKPEVGLSSSPALAASHIRKCYGKVVALEDVTLQITAGEIMTLLGPSGSGKTTLLKAIAGFEDVDGGTISLLGQDITDMAPAARNIGMVFQNYALFPHMTVEQNVGFPLRMRKMSRSEIRRLVQETLHLVELSDYGSRVPAQLSGGQQQRVALARAIVFRPPLLLLDEPFSALDRKLRQNMQLELRRLQSRLRLTALFVTHDQEEALVLSDRIAVMNMGRIEQLARPQDLYNHPASHFVAAFIGESNMLDAEVTHGADGLLHVRTTSGDRLVVRHDCALAPSSRVKLLLRPEKLRPLAGLNVEENMFHGQIIEHVYLGDSCKIRVRLPTKLELLLRVQPDADNPLNLGQQVAIGCFATDIRVLK